MQGTGTQNNMTEALLPHKIQVMETYKNALRTVISTSLNHSWEKNQPCCSKRNELNEIISYGLWLVWTVTDGACKSVSDTRPLRLDNHKASEPNGQLSILSPHTWPVQVFFVRRSNCKRSRLPYAVLSRIPNPPPVTS